MKNGALFTALFNIGLDPIEEVELMIRREVNKIEKLQADGTRKEVTYRKEGERYILDTYANTLEPLILFIS